MIRERQQPRGFLGEGLADAQRVVSGALAIRRDAAAPSLGLDIEVVHIGEVASSEEAVAHIADGALDATLLISPRHSNGARFVTIMSGELDQGGVETDSIAATFQHSAF
jgi:hypothetical protein